jgi:hypothetical protein
VTRGWEVSHFFVYMSEILSMGSADRIPSGSISRNVALGWTCCCSEQLHGYVKCMITIVTAQWHTAHYTLWGLD